MPLATSQKVAPMPQSTFQFTLASLDAIKPTDRQQWFTDGKQRALQLCVTPAGNKTFYLYKWIDGKPRREKLGRYPLLTLDDARQRARERLRELERGEDTVGSQRATFSAAFQAWLSNHARKVKRTWKEDQRKFERDLVDLHDKKLTQLRKNDIETLHNRLAESSGKTHANRCLALIKCVINYAIDDESFQYRGANPARGVRKFPERSRERYLAPVEMRRFFTALKGEPDVYRDFFLVLLFTGVRRGNCLKMEWRDVDLDFKIWQLTETKGGKPILVPLAPAVVEILKSRKEHARNAWVFPSTRHPGKPLHDVRKSWGRILKNAEIEDLHIHDLRRTLGSWQAMAGTSELIIGKSLGHAAGSKATSVYARLDLNPVRESVERVVGQMLALEAQQ
jgi:integrase